MTGYGKSSEGLELPLFDLATIATATNNFSIKNMLGEGGFGPVYKVKQNQTTIKKRKEYKMCVFNLLILSG